MSCTFLSFCANVGETVNSGEGAKKWSRRKTKSIDQSDGESGE
jgi:hypothetical protein